jgi:hypothetical protein
LPQNDKSSQRQQGQGSAGLAEEAAAARVKQSSGEELALEGIEYVGKPCTHVCAKVRLPAGRKWIEQDFSVRAGIDSLHVSVKGCSPLAVGLNVYIKQRGCSCTVTQGTLSVTAPLKPVREILADAEAARPLPLGTLELQSDRLVGGLD